MARVRAVRERDSRLGLQQASARAPRRAARSPRLDQRAAALDAPRRTTVADLGRCASARRCTCQARGRGPRRRGRRRAPSPLRRRRAPGSADHTRLAAVEGLLERRADARRAEAAPQRGRELDEVAAHAWLRRARRPQPDGRCRMSVTDVTSPDRARSSRSWRCSRPAGARRRDLRRRPSRAALEATRTAATGATGRAAATPAAPLGGRAVVAEAKKYLGVPYVWGGTDPAESGMDCSGLVQHVYEQARHRPAPRLRRPGPGRHAGRLDGRGPPGDLIAWDNSSRNNGADHIAIYIGDGKMIEAPAHRPRRPHRRRARRPPTTSAGCCPSRRRPGGPAGAVGGTGARPRAMRGGTPYADLFHAARRAVRRRPGACSPPSPGRSPASTRTPSAPPARRA